MKKKDDPEFLRKCAICDLNWGMKLYHHKGVLTPEEEQTIKEKMVHLEKNPELKKKCRRKVQLSEAKKRSRARSQIKN
jgi:hypothetical protein